MLSSRFAFPALDLRRCGGMRLAMRVPPAQPVVGRFNRPIRTYAAAGDSEPEASNHASAPPTAPEAAPPTAPEAATPTFSNQLPADDAFEVTADDIKAALLDNLYGTERGLSARSELRAEINELISQMEAKNPTPNPTEALEKLDGTWRLVYTSSSALLAVLSLGKLPLVTVGDMLQKIDSASMTVENTVQLSGPLSRTSLSTTASIEVKSPKRLQLKLEKGMIATPQLTSDLDIPSSVTVLGQFIDLTQLKDSVNPLKDQAEGFITQVNQLIGQVPALGIPLEKLEDAQTWQLTTYADETLRIARGDRGAVFIYTLV